jgi:hypothetical protein
MKSTDPVMRSADGVVTANVSRQHWSSIAKFRYAQRRWISTPPSRLDDGGGWRGQNGVSGWERRGRRRPDGSDGVRVDAPTAWMWQNGNIAHHLKEASVGRVGTVGLDLATNVFQVQGADVSGVVIFLKKAAMSASACFFLKPASLHGGDGSLRRWMRPVVGALFFVRK